MSPMYLAGKRNRIEPTPWFRGVPDDDEEEDEDEEEEPEDEEEDDDGYSE